MKRMLALAVMGLFLNAAFPHDVKAVEGDVLKDATGGEALILADATGGEAFADVGGEGLLLAGGSLDVPGFTGDTKDIIRAGEGDLVKTMVDEVKGVKDVPNPTDIIKK